MSQFKHLANRKHELALANRMLRRECEQRILLIEAASGFGKTHLLTQIRRDCATISPQPLLVSFDLKADERGLDYLYEIVYRQLETQAKNVDLKAIFAAYHEQTQQQHAYRVSVNVNNNTVLGKQDVLVQLPEATQAQLASLATAREREFFAAVTQLSNHQPLVMLIDNLNTREGTLEKWVENTLLHQIALMPQVTLIVAGHVMPSQSMTWDDCCERIQLEPIHDIDVWTDWVCGLGTPLTPDQVEPLVFGLKGQPKNIAEILPVFAKTKQARRSV